MRNFAIRKLDQLLPDLFFGQKCKPFSHGGFRKFPRNAGSIIEIIIRAQVVIEQDFINKPAAFAAKLLFVKANQLARTLVTAVITGGQLCGGYILHEAKIFPKRIWLYDESQEANNNL